MRNQRTIKNPVTIQGTGLHSGDDITVTLRPAEVDTGVVFIRTDLPGKPRIPLRRESVLQKDRQTAIAEGHAEVQTVEHLAASLLALGVDNVEVEVTLHTPIAMDETLKFAIREGGRTVGAGRVTEIIE